MQRNLARRGAARTQENEVMSRAKRAAVDSNLVTLDSSHCKVTADYKAVLQNHINRVNATR